jgi:hypothetical protein
VLCARHAADLVVLGPRVLLADSTPPLEALRLPITNSAVPRETRVRGQIPFLSWERKTVKGNAGNIC